MSSLINTADMNWIALLPELTLLVTGLFLLLVGLSKTLNTNRYLSLASLSGILIALAFSVALWGMAPSAATGQNPGMFSNALLHDKFSQSFNIIFLAMSLIPIFGSVRYPQADNENKAEYFSLVLFATMGMMFLAKSGEPDHSVYRVGDFFHRSLYSLRFFPPNTEPGGKAHRTKWS